MINYTNSISPQDYRMLRKSADFMELSERQIETALQNYAFLIAAKDEDETIGVTRLIWDGAYAALLVDVIVLPDYQNQGIGKTMVEKTIDFIKENTGANEPVMITLIASEHKEGFYEKLGFTACPSEHYGAGLFMWVKG